MIGIYKVTNNINNKVYIGQSNQIEARWKKHCHRSLYDNGTDYNCVFYRAIRKYGLENFTFEVIEECKEEELDEKEKYWIKQYNSFLGFENCNGYNMTLGGQNNIPHKLTYKKVEEIQHLLLTTKISQTDIGNQYNISQVTVSQINCGLIWHNEELDYPLRNKKYKQNYCIDCGAKIGTRSTRCVSCAAKYNKLMHPQSKIKPNKEELLQIIKDNKGNFTKIGNLFGITGNAVRKWCKSYDLPYHSKDYK